MTNIMVLGVYYHKNGNKFYEGHFVVGLPG